MTDTETNEAVARKLGLCVKRPCGCDLKHYYGNDYCHSIEAAWEVVEHLRKRPNPNALINLGYGFELHSTPTKYVAIITGPTWKQILKEEANTAPMAIALAFLKLP